MRVLFQYNNQSSSSKEIMMSSSSRPEARLGGVLATAEVATFSSVMAIEVSGTDIDGRFMNRSGLWTMGNRSCRWEIDICRAIETRAAVAMSSSIKPNC